MCVKDEQLRKSNALLEKYTVLLEQKSQRIEQLLDRMVELSERAVQYPAKKHQMPMLVVAREINSIRAITGQRIHVAKKRRDLASDADVIIDAVRPNPQVDFNNIVNEVETVFGDRVRARNKRNMVFETEDDAIEVATMCKSLLVVPPSPPPVKRGKLCNDVKPQ